MQPAGHQSDMPDIQDLQNRQQTILNIMFQVFCQPDVSFSLKPNFREVFCIDNVREGLVVGFLHHLTATARGFCDSGDSKSPPAILLLLSKMCLEFETSSVHYLVSVN
jgi:hypothetical protein